MDTEWWGFSREHGWVVLDRELASNRPGITNDLLFYRCRDSATYIEKRAKWNPPEYRFAPNYLRELMGQDALDANAMLEEFKALWPAARKEIERELREELERAEAARLEEEKRRKREEREAKARSKQESKA